MILLIDNYDSFSYNLYQYIGEINPDIKVVKNDELSVDEIKKLKPDRIILSPGPGRPEYAGMIIEAVKKLGGEIPILGVCLGHQAICSAYGAKVTYAKQLMHGKQSEVKFDKNCLLFKNCPEGAKAVQHKEYPVFGVQFHPESIMTPDGKTMLKNFINNKSV